MWRQPPSAVESSVARQLFSAHKRKPQLTLRPALSVLDTAHICGVDEVGGAGDGAGVASTPLFTRSFNSLLGLKKGIFLAGTSTRSPVFGFRPTRGLRCLVLKLPKPRISILSPTRSERTTLSNIVSTITSLSLRVSSARRETSSIRSALVISFLALCNSGLWAGDLVKEPS